jgi:DNA-binding transcriptional ArsR family regulator
LAAQDPIFHALADPTRRSLLEYLLTEGEANVVRLTKVAGVSQPAVSKHLATLKAAGLVIDRPEGRQTRYSAKPDALWPLYDWLQFYSAFWDRKIDALADTLKRMDQ